MNNHGQPLHTRHIRMSLEFEVTCAGILNMNMEQIFCTTPETTESKLDVHLSKSHVEIIDPETGKKIGENTYVRT